MLDELKFAIHFQWTSMHIALNYNHPYQIRFRRQPFHEAHQWGSSHPLRGTCEVVRVHHSCTLQKTLLLLLPTALEELSTSTNLK